MNPITEFYAEKKRFEALCVIRNQLPEKVKSSRKLEAMATKHIFVATKSIYTDYTTLMQVLGFNRTMQYRYIHNIKAGHFRTEIAKYKYIDSVR